MEVVRPSEGPTQAADPLYGCYVNMWHRRLAGKTELQVDFRGHSSARAFVEALQGNSVLTSLLLDKARAGDFGACEIAGWLQSNRSVTSLQLERDSVGHVGARALAEVLKRNSTLITMSLTKNSIGDEGARAVADALLSNSALVTLQLSSNSIGMNGALALALALKENSTLSALSLWGNSVGDEGACALAEALKGNATLTSLNLSSNSIGVVGARALAEALTQNSGLISLNLRCNSIGVEGTKTLADALKRNPALECLDLGHNSIGDEGTIALAGALKENSALKSLNLHRNSMGDDGARAIISALELNPFLEELFLIDDGISGTFVYQIKKAVKDIGRKERALQKRRDLVAQHQQPPAAPIGQRSFEINAADLVFGPYLGGGRYGTVFEGTCQSHIKVAIKRYHGSSLSDSRQSDKAIAALEWEMNVLSQVPDHDNVMQLIGWCPAPPCLVMHLMKGGTAKMYLAGLSNQYEPHAVHRLLFQVALGMNHLHSRPTPILHLDLKGDNILVDENGTAKVSDFGMSKIRATASLHSTNRGGGTPVFMAPESFATPKPRPGTATDVYAFGMTMWELLSEGQIPLVRDSRDLGLDMFKERIRTDPRFRPQRPPRCPDATWLLMQRCWAMDAASRPAFAEIADELKRILDTLDTDVSTSASSSWAPSISMVAV
ncbi:hypothetical protein DFJ74DRAFT_689227 [Hyaloraphidium curvatum]|nr:hypothetical protein DFJ74DRAFT_689227 [Hyaloraphidium curvatum]